MNHLVPVIWCVDTQVCVVWAGSGPIPRGEEGLAEKRKGRNKMKRKKKDAGRRREAWSHMLARVLSGHARRRHSNFRRRPGSVEKRGGNESSVGDDDARVGSVRRGKNCGGRFL